MYHNDRFYILGYIRTVFSEQFCETPSAMIVTVITALSDTFEVSFKM